MGKNKDAKNICQNAKMEDEMKFLKNINQNQQTEMRIMKIS